MKTFNGKKIMMSEIHEVLRSMDRTAIFRLVKTIYGEVDYRMVFYFVDRYGPTKTIRNSAYDIAYFHQKRHYYEILHKRHIEYRKANKYHIAMQWFKYHIKNTTSRYAKRPIMDKTNLYFASPIYGLEDYNKCEFMPIAGNERFCETICKLADKYFPKYEQQ